MHAARKRETREGMLGTGIFTPQEECRLVYLAASYDRGEIPGDSAQAPPTTVDLLVTPRAVHLVAFPLEDPYATFCRRRPTGEEAIEWGIPWAQATRRVTCEGCRANGIRGRDL